MRPEPCVGKALRLRDLRGTHFPRLVVAGLLGAGQAPGRGSVEPSVSLHDILMHSAALPVEETDSVLRLDEAILGCRQIPFESQRIILVDAPAFIVVQTEIELGDGVALDCLWLEQSERRLAIAMPVVNVPNIKC